jgi:L-cystine uptake protein TcyP (sodium:dicarboxylate symporter family)
VLSIGGQLQGIIFTHLRSKPVFRHVLNLLAFCYINLALRFVKSNHKTNLRSQQVSCVLYFVHSMPTTCFGFYQKSSSGDIIYYYYYYYYYYYLDL